MSGGILQERVRFAGSLGRLAGELAYPWSQPQAAALIVNPHPYMGGHMDNNVVAALAAGLARAGLATLRFDYAGVGESSGPAVDLVAGMAEFWSTGRSPMDRAMSEDVASAAKWLRANAPLPLVLVGYSFGAHAAQAALADHVAAVVLVSPTVVHHDLFVLAALTLPRLVIYSDKDFSTPRQRTEAWLAAMTPPVVARCIRGANHFFKGRETELVGICRRFLSEHLVLKEEAA